MLYIEAMTSTDGDRLVWDSDGYYAFGHDSWKNVDITTTMIYQNGDIGIIPRFDSEITYVAFTVGNRESIPDSNVTLTGTTTIASIFAQISGQTIYLGEKQLSTALVPDQQYTIKAIVKKTNYKIYLDGTLIFSVEYNGLNNGSAAVYATTGNKCTSIEVNKDFPSNWTSNVSDISGAIVDWQELENKDKFIFMENPSLTENLYIEQTTDIDIATLPPVPIPQEDLVNLVLDLPINQITTSKVVGGDISVIVDGEITGGVMDFQDGEVSVELDLGELRYVSHIQMWHYYFDGRSYHDNVLEISADGSTWETVFDSNVDGEYAESVDGHTVYIGPKIIRYVRNSINGSTANPGSHLVEIMVFGSVEVPGRNYIISYEKEGTANILIKELNGISLKEAIITGDDIPEWERVNHLIPISADCSQVAIQFIVPLTEDIEVPNTVSINDVQLEPSDFVTTYMENSSLDNTSMRGNSYITFPSKNNINPEIGSISMWVKPDVEWDPDWTHSWTFFEYGDSWEDSIRVEYSNGVGFDHGGMGMHSGSSILQRDKWHHIAASWTSNRKVLYVDGVQVMSMPSFANDPIGSDIIRIGHSILEGHIFQGVIDDLIVFSKEISPDRVTALFTATEPVRKTDDMILRATFDYAIGSFNRSIIEMTPAPIYGSPVIVTKSDDVEMEKVSFFDPYTGEYRTYNKERITYDGKTDYIRVGYDNIDTENFKVNVKDSQGALIGDPYTVEQNKIYLTLTEQQKKDLRGRHIYVSYQPENPFAVDFNIGQPDSFRVTLGKHDGKPVTIQYEGNRFSDEKLATMIELNPLLNPNHKGFMYIVREGNSVSTFRMKATPSSLPADGVSEAIIVIEPLDENGNFISHARLNVSAKEGSVIPNYDAGSIKLRERAGRYIYRYRAPLIYFSDRNKVEVIDKISVVDTVSGLGVQVSIDLAIFNEYYTSDQAQTVEQANWEQVAINLLSRITDHIGKKTSSLPAGLGTILDFNDDGMIDINEIIWLNTYKFTQALYEKYMELLEWEQLN